MIIKCIWSIDIWMIVPIRREVVKFQFITMGGTVYGTTNFVAWKSSAL